MKTGDPKLVARLNELLGRELGRNSQGAPMFSWEWSDELWWPATRTGRNTTKKVRVPILGSAETDCVDLVVPEYVRAPMTSRRSTWFMTKWLSPEELIYGGSRGHGRGYAPGEEPSLERLKSAWDAQSPGADFPAQGLRFPLDVWLPRSPEDPSTPNLPDTEFFIARVREQTSLSAGERLRDMLAQDDQRQAAQSARVGDEIRDSFPAFLNLKPGARGGDVSFPSPGAKLS